MNILSKNPDYSYILVSDRDGYKLIQEYFDQRTLNAFLKLQIGAAKGDFIRYIALYVYGGIYLDLDSTITIELSQFLKEDPEFVFFYDWDKNIEQWSFMTAPKNPILKRIIDEMLLRIEAGEPNIFLATGPTLFTDVIYNDIQNTHIYNTKTNISNTQREEIFAKHTYYKNGQILDMNRHDREFVFNLPNYDSSMVYENPDDKYRITFNTATPRLYR
jgi:mannosyltransferase OCH1-like enzyme